MNRANLKAFPEGEIPGVAMKPDPVVTILFVEEDPSVWPRAEAFFSYQLGLIGTRARMHFRKRLPKRAAGFDVVSLDGRNLIATLLEHPDLMVDLHQTAILNLHADAPGAAYGHLRRLLGRRDQGRRSDGLWVFPQSWMAPWFKESLEFSELRSARPTPALLHRTAPRHGAPAAELLRA